MTEDRKARTLSWEQARAFYDRFGAKQDSQGFYEDRATADLVAHSAFGEARSIFEFGCGTGRFAETLLDTCLPADASYLGVDISNTMAALARERLGRFGDRAAVRLTNGDPHVDAPAGGYDRFVSNYVLDLLSDEDARKLVSEAYRLLRSGGFLCLVSLSNGVAPVSRLVSRVWAAVHAVRPTLVGGCRPIDLLPLVREPEWEVLHQCHVTPFGIPSEIVVARKR
jgi:ubiquinone/menaquinone biosynthesis C-methylase UbiE